MDDQFNEFKLSKFPVLFLTMLLFNSYNENTQFSFLH